MNTATFQRLRWLKQLGMGLLANSPMKVPIKLSQRPTAADELKAPSDFLNCIAAEWNLPLEHISQVPVADDVIFGAAGEEVFLGIGFTDEGVYRAIGKVVHRRNQFTTCRPPENPDGIGR